MALRQAEILKKDLNATIVWLSGIEKPITAAQIAKKWGMSSGYIDKYLKENRKKLFEADLIILPQYQFGRDIPMSSKLDWLVGFQLVGGLITKDDMLEILNSDVFRKGCMNLDLIIEHYKIDKMIEGMIENIGEFSKELATKKPWTSTKIDWRIVLTRFRYLALFRSFEMYPKILEYCENDMLSEISLSYRDAFSIYEFIKKQGYKIPEKIAPMYTLEGIINKIVKNYKEYTKELKKWPEIWKKIIGK